jgi:predicted amidohydrolase YtcJ
VPAAVAAAGRRNPAGQLGPACRRRSAAAGNAEHVKGTIAPGYLADFTLLSEGPTAVSADAIAATTVLAAFVGGQCRYDASGRGQLS